jgi:hypothetical protein
MRSKLTLLLILTCGFVSAQEIDEYICNYKISGRSDIKLEKTLITNYSYRELSNELTPYFNDSIVTVRQKSYYIIYKKGITSDTQTQKDAVIKILSGCNDKNGGLVGQLLSILHEFPNESFDEEAKNKIELLLQQKRIFHFKKLVLLAGKVGSGQEIMQKMFLNPEISQEKKWALSLALARQGSHKHMDYCMETIKNISINSEFISFVIPDLIYTRNRHAIDFCVEIIFSDKKDCYSANPDKPEYILCAYRVMELIAPVIIGFPFETDATGSLVTNDYQQALTITREWFNNNPTFEIRQ